MAWLAFKTMKRAIRFPYTKHTVCCTYSIILQNNKQRTPNKEPIEQPQKTVTPFPSARSWCWKVLQGHCVLFYNQLDCQYQILDFAEKITDLLQCLKNTTCHKEHSPFCWRCTKTPIQLNNLCCIGRILTFWQGNNTYLINYSVTWCKAQ